MRIAIVGSGVAGLVAAHHLHPRHDITVFEAGDRIGGHVHTWELEVAGRCVSVDSGFIVYNERNYPTFTRLLDVLGVETRASEMSFSVRHDATGLEYNGSTLRQLFVQPRNLVHPRFLRMVAEILRFNRDAVGQLQAAPDGISLGGLLELGGYSAAFRDWYLLPMGSAIWSVSARTVLDMPAAFFIRFFENHGMLTVDDRPLWRTITGGSMRYVDALVAPFRDRIRLRTPVRRIERTDGGVLVDGAPFDRVVLACHSDQALALLADASAAEREVLGALPYQRNDIVLHTDTSLLPRARSAWAAWNYRVGDDPEAPASVTYDMNILQGLDTPETICVTLNASDAIDPARILGRVVYDHPVATAAGMRARARRIEISGQRATHFCGAYWGNGFHEDGVVSALAVAQEVDRAVRATRPRAALVSA